MKKRLYLAFSLVLLLVVGEACRKEVIDVVPVNQDSIIPEPQLNASQIYLKWYQNDTETKEDIEIGLKWCFSFLGASLPTRSMEKAMVWEGENTIKLDVAELGFSSHAHEKLKRLISAFKQSESYRQNNAADVGRWVAVIFNNSNHYYEITGVPKSFDDFKNQYTYQSKLGGIIESQVSVGHRRIWFPRELEYGKMGFIAEELVGSIVDTTFSVKEYEVMDIMPNGQQRFAVYDLSGKLVVGASKVFSIGGKPAKCLWCHESEIPKAFTSKTSIAGYYSIQEFDSIIGLCNQELKNRRSSLASDLDFAKTKDHTQLEKLYIRFMEPSAKRLAQEWKMTENQVQEKLANIATHIHHEFPEMGNLYHRKVVDPLATFRGLEVSNDARELEGDEPNYLR